MNQNFSSILRKIFIVLLVLFLGLIVGFCFRYLKIDKNQESVETGNIPAGANEESTNNQPSTDSKFTVLNETLDKSSDPLQVCENINDVKMKDECYIELAIRINKDISICDKISDLIYRDRCKTFPDFNNVKK